MNNLLKIIQPVSYKKLHEDTCREKWEKKWSEEKKKNDCWEKERLKRILELLRTIDDLSELQIVDLGSGDGALLKELPPNKYPLHALDIAQSALQRINTSTVSTFQDILPNTKLPSNSYELVICTEVIAELPSQQQRLLMSECARLLKKGGYLLLSSDLDINTLCPWEKLRELIETEFLITRVVISYHQLHIRLPLFKQSRRLLLILERIQKFFSEAENGSSVIVLATKKNLHQEHPAARYWNLAQSKNASLDKLPT